MNTLMPNTYHARSVDERADIDAWIVDHGFVPTEVTRVDVDGASVTFTVLELDDSGKPFARGGDIASTPHTVDLKSDPPWRSIDAQPIERQPR